MISNQDILHLLRDTCERLDSKQSRELWPQALQGLPMHDAHKGILKTHWQNLQPQFRIT